MTPAEPKPPYNTDPVHLARTGMEAMRIGNEILLALIAKSKDKDWGDQPLDPFNLRGAWMAFMEKMMADPSRMHDAQMALMQDYANLASFWFKRMQGENAQDLATPERGDKRFKNDMWDSSMLFDFIKQGYLLTSRWLLRVVDENTTGLDPQMSKKLHFFTQQFIDAVSPTNFPATNPDVLAMTLETGGDNLVRGMNNLLEDIKRGGSLANIRMTDETAFTVGGNIATTPGKVIYRTRMMELVQYTPTKPKTHARPLVITPPWINKYYILDLRADNSFVRHALDAGHSVFMISWVNPDAKYNDVTFTDYMKEGVLAALDKALEVTKADKANMVGYCIGGTLLTMTLSHLKKKKQDAKVASATFLTTLIDFENAGDLKIFVDEGQLEVLTHVMAEKGYLESDALKTTFSLLRANDLIWSFVVNNYLMGREPFPFDLLYWNGDSTNLPAAMHAYYLRHMYLNNDLIKPDCLKIGGTPVDVRGIDTPVYFLSTREDHITPWKATYDGMKLFKGPKTFTLAASGHIAGVVNPPAANKYCFWTSSHIAPEAESWLEKAAEQRGSWWPHWAHWLEKYAGPKVDAHKPAAAAKLGNAPGRYVLQKR